MPWSSEQFQDLLRRIRDGESVIPDWYRNGERRDGAWARGWYDQYKIILPLTPARTVPEDSPLPDPVPIEAIEVPGGLTQEEITAAIDRAMAKAGISPEEGRPPPQTDPEAEEPPSPKRKGRFQNLEL